MNTRRCSHCTDQNKTQWLCKVHWTGKFTLLSTDKVLGGMYQSNKGGERMLKIMKFTFVNLPFTIIENNLTYICVYVFICWCVFTVCAKVGSWQQPVNTCMCVCSTPSFWFVWELPLLLPVSCSLSLSFSRSLLVNTWQADSLVGTVLTASKRAASSVQSTPWQSRLRWYVCSFTAQDCTKTMCSMSRWPWRVCYRFLEFTPTAQTDRQTGLLIAIIYIYMNRFYIRYLHVYLYLLAVCFGENVSSHIKGPEKHDPKKPWKVDVIYSLELSSVQRLKKKIQSDKLKPNIAINFISMNNERASEKWKQITLILPRW